MVRIDSALAAGEHQSAMLLQVHDVELVFECPPEEVPAMSALVKREMEGVYDLAVPLVVDVGVGDNWRDAKVALISGITAWAGPGNPPGQLLRSRI